MTHRLRLLTLAAIAAVLLGCASSPRVEELVAADVVLLGERHDDPAHHEKHREVVEALAARGRLGAVTLEMAEQGTTTAGLPRTADEATVRQALQWKDEAWPWTAYGPAVMAAVRAGAPVLGANLPRARMRDAMQDAALDTALDPTALAAQQEAVRTGHCGLMPERQIAPMARVQVARDRAMAETIARVAAAPGRTVVLLTGAGHADPKLGVPRHLPAKLSVRPVVLPSSGRAPQRDHCADLRKQFGRG